MSTYNHKLSSAFEIDGDSLGNGSPKVALVTGCSHSQSLGAAVSLDLKGRGWRVFASARRLDSEGMVGLKLAGVEVSSGWPCFKVLEGSDFVQRHSGLFDWYILPRVRLR